MVNITPGYERRENDPTLIFRGVGDPNGTFQCGVPGEMIDGVVFPVEIAPQKLNQESLAASIMEVQEATEEVLEHQELGFEGDEIILMGHVFPSLQKELQELCKGGLALVGSTEELEGILMSIGTDSSITSLEILKSKHPSLQVEDIVLLIRLEHLYDTLTKTAITNYEPGAKIMDQLHTAIKMLEAKVENRDQIAEMLKNLGI